MKRRIPQLDPPVPRRRVLSAQETELWYSIMGVSAEDEELVGEDEQEEALSSPPKKTKKLVKRKAPQPPQPMDGATRTRIRKGKAAIEATLDLHGYTVEVAYSLLLGFIARNIQQGTRVVLVITGKGRAPQSGILRAQLPRWLEIPPLKDQVSTFSLADRSHGGEGAWYIRLRKSRLGKT